MKKKLILLILLMFVTGCANDDKEVINVLNWSSYIPDSIIRNFEKEYNIDVNYSTYSSNEELLAKVSNVKNGTYDLVFPSDYMVEVMRAKGLLQTIDTKRLENYQKIDSKYLNLDYDVNNQYSVPFLASSVVIVINREVFSDEINSYNDLLNEKYKSSIVLIDDSRIVIGSALMALGYDMNSKNSSELEKAKSWLLKLKPNIKAFDSDSPKSFIISGEADIGLMWSAEAILAKKEKDNLEIIVPVEGYFISTDNFVIMKGSNNIDNVYLFIDYILSSGVMKEIVSHYPYLSVNAETNRMMALDKESGNDYFKIQMLIQNGERVRNIGSSIALYDKIWAAIK